MKFTTDFCEILDGFLRNLGVIFVKFRKDFCEVYDRFL